MHRSVLAILVSVILSISLTHSAKAQIDPKIKQIAALSDFVAKVELLDGMVEDLVLSGALALLSRGYPEWTFEGHGGFESYGAGVNPLISNDIGATASDVEQAFIYIKGGYVSSDAISDEQRVEITGIIDAILELVRLSKRLEERIEETEQTAAASLYRNDIVPTANDLSQRLHSLITRLNQTIKFSAL